MKMKNCIKCGELKTLAEFYAHPQMADGRLGKCKECYKVDVKANREKNHERYIEFDKQRAMLPHRVAARKEYSKSQRGKDVIKAIKNKWQKQNPEKRAAHILLNNCLKNGRITKLPCQVCGSKIRIHGHHNDYAKPLDVIWLCPKHHNEHHKIKEANNVIR